MKYDICDECGNTDIVGYLECENKNLCPECAAKKLNQAPAIIRDALIRAEKIRALEDEINISYACRALLGGGKGLAVMQVILEKNPGYYEKVMAKAKKRLNDGKGVVTPTIVHCDKCGEYLGDRIEGVLYKFGRVVDEPHLCPGVGNGNLPEL